MFYGVIATEECAISRDKNKTKNSWNDFNNLCLANYQELQQYIIGLLTKYN